MAKWNIPASSKDQRSPDQILQEQADALIAETNGKLAGQVIEQINYDSEDRPKLFYALHIYVNNLMQAYRLFEVEQISETPYPVNFRVILYTGSVTKDNIQSPEELSLILDSYSKSPLVGNLLAHFIKLSDLKKS